MADKDASISGRWTAEEHDLFEKGLQLYGRDWRKISSLIPTRNIVQIRTHAQKYFLKQQKSAANPEQCSPQMKVAPTPAGVKEALEAFQLQASAAVSTLGGGSNGGGGPSPGRPDAPTSPSLAPAQSLSRSSSSRRLSQKQLTRSGSSLALCSSSAAAPSGDGAGYDGGPSVLSGGAAHLMHLGRASPLEPAPLNSVTGGTAGGGQGSVGASGSTVSTALHAYVLDQEGMRVRLRVREEVVDEARGEEEDEYDGGDGSQDDDDGDDGLGHAFIPGLDVHRSGPNRGSFASVRDDDAHSLADDAPPSFGGDELDDARPSPGPPAYARSLGGVRPSGGVASIAGATQPLMSFSFAPAPGGAASSISASLRAQLQNAASASGSGMLGGGAPGSYPGSSSGSGLTLSGGLLLPPSICVPRASSYPSSSGHGTPSFSAQPSPLAGLYRRSLDEADDHERDGCDSVLSELDADVAALALRSAPGTPLHAAMAGLAAAGSAGGLHAMSPAAVVAAAAVRAAAAAASGGGGGGGSLSRRGSSFYLSRAAGSSGALNAAVALGSPKRALQQSPLLASATASELPPSSAMSPRSGGFHRLELGEPLLGPGMIMMPPPHEGSVGGGRALSGSVVLAAVTGFVPDVTALEPAAAKRQRVGGSAQQFPTADASLGSSNALASGHGSVSPSPLYGQQHYYQQQQQQQQQQRQLGGGSYNDVGLSMDADDGHVRGGSGGGFGVPQARVCSPTGVTSGFSGGVRPASPHAAGDGPKSPLGGAGTAQAHGPSSSDVAPHLQRLHMFVAADAAATLARVSSQNGMAPIPPGSECIASTALSAPARSGAAREDSGMSIDGGDPLNTTAYMGGSGPGYAWQALQQAGGSPLESGNDRSAQAAQFDPLQFLS